METDRTRRTRRGRAIPRTGRLLWRGLRWTFTFFGVLILLWAAGLAWFGFTMPEARTNARTKTDAVVVLTGGARRLPEGLRLLKAGLAPVLFISGVNRKVEKGALLRVAGGAPEALKPKIILGYRAEHTRGNAYETALWARSRQLKTIRLVTANYHMRRSLLELRRALPSTRIIAHPVSPKLVASGRWWRTLDGINIVATEFNKYVAAVIRLTLTPEELRTGDSWS